MCGHQSRSPRGEVASGRPVDPNLRASQAERDRVVDSLRRHAGEGRLDVEELEDRVERALTARTRGELAALEADLPRERRRPQSTRARAGGMVSGLALLPLLVGLAVIVFAPPAIAWIGWVAVGWWFFAGLPFAGFGLAVCGHSRRRRQRTAATV